MKNSGMENEEQYVAFCDCGSESVVVTRWKDDEYKEIYLSMWGMRYRHQISLSEKWRHIWRIIKEGYPYEDDIVLHPDSAKALGIILVEYADNWIENKK